MTYYITIFKILDYTGYGGAHFTSQHSGGQPSQGKFQASQGYTSRSCLNKQKAKQIPDYHLSTVNVSFNLFIFLLFPLSTSSTLKPVIKSRPWWQVLYREAHPLPWVVILKIY